MKHRSVTILVAVVAIAAFGIGYFILPPRTVAPASMSPAAPLPPTPMASSVPTDAVIIPLSIVSVHEDASTSPTVDIEYPQFPSLPADLDAAITDAVTSRLADFRRQAADTEAARDSTDNNLPGQPGAALPPSDYSFTATWQESEINDRFISFIIRFDEYTGGANENQDLQTFNYDVRSQKALGVADMFPGTADYLGQLSAISRQQLTDSLTTASPGYDPTAMLDAGTAPIADDFANFTFNGDTVTFYFPKYAVAPGSFGEQRVTITKDEVK